MISSVKKNTSVLFENYKIKYNILFKCRFSQFEMSTVNANIQHCCAFKYNYTFVPHPAAHTAKTFVLPKENLQLV